MFGEKGGEPFGAEVDGRVWVGDIAVGLVWLSIFALLKGGKVEEDRFET